MAVSQFKAWLGFGLVLALAFAAETVQAQTAPDTSGVAGKLLRYQRRGPLEKLFLHLDRPVYLSGETMWFRVYAADGTTARPLALSSVAYVEVLNAEHEPVLQAKVALKNATGQGSFVLPAALGAGTYTVRAYTSWMKNFSPEGYFHATVTVINTSTASGAGSKDSAAYDARFFPEGGNLVRGLRSRIAFKVTDKAGRGVPAAGKVLNQNGAVVATFSTLRQGMGSFELTPTGTDTYTAVVTLAQKQVLTRLLPRVFERGYVLRLDHPAPDQLTLTVSASGTQPETVFLLGHSRQKVAVATPLQLIDGRGTLVINKAQLLDGVSHFTLFNASQQPVCERLYFQVPRQTLAITARPDKPQYTIRDRVSMQVTATDTQTPLATSLSMAVYRLDSLAAAPGPTIDRYLWLTADLRGAVENPDYYFGATGPEAAEATDNLLLTQGWSRFRWEDVLTTTLKPLAYLPEPYGPVVQARLTRAGTGQPLQGAVTYLASPSRIIELSEAQSDAQGMVRFEPPHFVGSRDIILQTDPAQDSTAQLAVLDPFSAAYATVPGASFGVTPRFQADYARRHFQAQVQNAFSGKYRNRYAAERVDSLAFYGHPDETYLLDKYTRFKVMEEVLREYVPGVVVRIRKDGFHLLVLNKLNKTISHEKPMVLLDGVPVFNINKIMAMNPLKIQKLEVIDSRYFHGTAVYDGIVSFTTYKGDLEGFPLDPRVLVQQYEGVQRQREFYAPRYDTPQARQSRLPDLRNLLYWNADVATGPNAKPVEFFTGDQAGRYLVVLQGLSATGLAGSHRFVLEVKPAL